MSLGELLRRNKIEIYRISPEEINSKISIAEASLRSAKKTVQIDDPDVDDTTYKEAYNAILQAGYALMYSKGYRPKPGSHHYAVEQFIKSEFSDDFPCAVLQIFGRARKTRNDLQYDSAGVISHEEVEDLIAKADAFVATAKGMLGIPQA